MSPFATTVAASIENYIALQRSLGYQFCKQAASLHSFLCYVRSSHASGPLSQALAVDSVMAGRLTSNGRAIRYAVIRRFAEYHAAFDLRTETFDRRALPRSRAIPPPRILSEEELRMLMIATMQISTTQPSRGRTLATVIGLLASTGLRSGEALPGRSETSGQFCCAWRRQLANGCFDTVNSRRLLANEGREREACTLKAPVPIWSRQTGARSSRTTAVCDPRPDAIPADRRQPCNS